MLSAEPTTDPVRLERDDLQQQVADLFLRFIEQIHSGPAGPWLDLSLTMPQLKMLFVLDWLESAPMSQVAGRLRIGVSAATGLIDRLVEQGLARRDADPRDRRVVRVACTDDGRALVVQLRSAGAERLGRILEHVSLDDLSHCATAMTAVTEAAELEFQVKA